MGKDGLKVEVKDQLRRYHKDHSDPRPLVYLADMNGTWTGLR